MSINKNDVHARDHWSKAYDAIPKSVFATVCWHLANICSESADAEGMAAARFLEEIEALAANGIIPERQAAAAIKALKVGA